MWREKHKQRTHRHYKHKRISICINKKWFVYIQIKINKYTLICICLNIYYISHILSVFIKHLNEFRKHNMYHVYEIYIYKKWYFINLNKNVIFKKQLSYIFIYTHLMYICIHISCFCAYINISLVHFLHSQLKIIHIYHKIHHA